MYITDMKKILSILLLAISFHSFAQQHLLADTHNDALTNQLTSKADLARLQTAGNFDLVRAKEGGLNVQVFSIWCDRQKESGGAYALANREIDSLYALIRRNPDKMALVTNSSGLKKAVKQNKMAALIGVEGGHMIEGRMDYIDSLAKRGMCYLTLTWNNSTPWATSAYDEKFKKDSLTHHGLTDFGKAIVHHLNDLGVMIDLSHPSENTFYDVLATTNKPVIASHSCAYALNPHQRNLKDEQLKAIAKNGGVVFVNFYSGFVDSTYFKKQEAFLAAHQTELDSLFNIYHQHELSILKLSELHQQEIEQLRPPLSLLIKHIDYMVKMMGADHVGLGADYDGAESFPVGMDDVRDYPKIAVELRKLHYSEKDINKILGDNFVRVLTANQKR